MNPTPAHTSPLLIQGLLWLTGSYIWLLPTPVQAAQTGIQRSQISRCYQKSQTNTPKGLFAAGTCYAALVATLERQIASRAPTRQERQQYYLLASQAARLWERSASPPTKGLDPCQIRRDAVKLLGRLLARKMYLDTSQKQAAGTQQTSIKGKMSCASLTVQANHTRATICVTGPSSGKKCRSGIWQRRGLAPGRYQITVTYPGAAPQQRQLTLGPETSKTLSLRPPAAPLATLRLTTVPPAATVMLGDTPRGKTPLTLKLKPGVYQITLQKSRHKQVQLKVRLQPKQRQTITQPLLPLAPKRIPNKTRGALITAGLVVTALFAAGMGISYGLAGHYHAKANEAEVLWNSKQLSYQGSKQLYEDNAYAGNVARLMGHASAGGVGVGVALLIWGLTQPATRPLGGSASLSAGPEKSSRADSAR